MNSENNLPQSESPTPEPVVTKTSITEPIPSQNPKTLEAEEIKPEVESAEPNRKTLLKDLFKKKAKDTVDKSPNIPKKKTKKPTWLKVALGILAFIFLSLVVMGWKTYTVSMELKGKAMDSVQTARTAYDLFKDQDLAGSQSQIVILQEKLTDMKTTYQKVSFYKYLPWIKNYYIDGENGLIAGEHGLNAANRAMAELVPYADVLGFEGEDSFAGGTAENRIKVMIETLDKIMPAFDEITNELVASKDALLLIDPMRYPEQVRNLVIRESLIKVQSGMTVAIEGFVSFRPVLEEIPNLAGGNGERKKYLILFQNDNELRPTGGFLTAYSIIYVEDGKVTPEKSDDIYELDQKFRKRIPIPEALGKYLITERYWNLRDMNISPDFKLSMDQFFEHYQEVPGEPDDIDGIIAVDTEVLTSLLSILGPVTIPGGSTFSAEPDARCGGCAQVVYALSEIITRPTPYLREDRKGILGPLMSGTLKKAYGAPKEQWPALFETMWKQIEGRHIQLYFIDENAQAAAEAVGGAGRLIAPEDGSDFLAIVNANLAGAKSNLFTEYSVKQEIGVPENGKLEKTIEITYKNTRKADNCNLEAGKLCLNSTLKDWTRLYLPAGSELVDAQGFTNEPSTYEESGLTVIDGFFILEPLGAAKIKLTYTIPYSDQDIYRVNLWKQGGISPFETLFDVNGGEEKVLVDKDVMLEIEF